MRIAALALLILLASTAPAAAADRTAELIRQLDTCDENTVNETGPRLDVLLALADGRSAEELASLIRYPRTCTGYVGAVGHGEDEIVLVGSHRPVEPNMGAILWVDHGYWRAAAAPTGYGPSVQILRRGMSRELFMVLESGGSAGYIGMSAVRITGASATTFWRLPPDLTMEIGVVRFFDDDHLYIEGRSSRDPKFTWQSHAGWPGGAQRLFVRKGDTFVIDAARQARDPYWVMTGFVSAVFDQDASAMSRFASAKAVDQALDIAWPPRGPSVGPLELPRQDPLTDVATRERASWDAIPDFARGATPGGPAFGQFAMSFDGWRTRSEFIVRFDRDEAGWTISAIVPLLGSPTGNAWLTL